MITKSGGNRFSGSFRTTFTNDAWKALDAVPGRLEHRPRRAGLRADVRRPRCSRTSCGSSRRRRFEKNSTNITAPYTGFNYTKVVDDKRGEGQAHLGHEPEEHGEGLLPQEDAGDGQRQLQHDHGRGQPLQLQRRRVAAGGELPERADEQPVRRGAVLPAHHGHDRRRVELHGPAQGHAHLGPVARPGALQRADLLRGLPQRGQPPEQLGRVRQAQLLPLDEEPGLPQHRRRLRRLQGDAEEQPELVGQQLPRPGDRRRSSTARPSTRSSGPGRAPTSSGCRSSRRPRAATCGPTPGSSTTSGASTSGSRSTSASGTTRTTPGTRAASRSGTPPRGVPRLGATFDLRGDGKWTANVGVRPLRRAVRHADRRRRFVGRPPGVVQLLLPGPERERRGRRRTSPPSRRCRSSSTGSTPTAARTARRGVSRRSPA